MATDFAVCYLFSLLLPSRERCNTNRGKSPGKSSLALCSRFRRPTAFEQAGPTPPSPESHPSCLQSVSAACSAPCPDLCSLDTLPRGCAGSPQSIACRSLTFGTYRRSRTASKPIGEEGM